ncbi:MAG: hypothetical protein PHU63_02990 [Candidatus ainarchaeum sp.]|nr:hypothetical protein [Candidatus ainarchaeum sp.]
MKVSDSEITNLVEDIKSAEKKANEIKNKAISESEQILRNAKDEALKIKIKTEDSVVKKKNKLLEEGTSKIESKVNAVISDAKSEAEKLANVKLKQKLYDSLFEEIIQ